MFEPTELNVQNTIEANFFIQSFEFNFNPILLDHPPEPPPAYNLPLLAYVHPERRSKRKLARDVEDALGKH